jgi:hypothetical protein
MICDWVARLDSSRALDGGAMFDGFRTFLKDPTNQAVLGWICGGIAAVAGRL